METKGMKKGLVRFGVIFIILFCLTTDALSWQFATHAYIADHIGRERRLDNINEIYGAIVPDVFNNIFDYPQYLNQLAYETHGNFLKVWETARGKLQKSLAYGFVSHGIADLRTHDQAVGYAMVKARDFLYPQLPSQIKVQVDEEILIEMLHIIVENAVDILIKRNDPFIGQKITSSAILRSHQLPLLLVKAYGSDFASTFGISPLEASRFLVSAEKEFRKSFILYGQMLTLDESTAIQLISQETAGAAAGYLSLFEINLTDLFQNEEDLVNFIVELTYLSISICESDYQEEIEATIIFVDSQMRGNGITY